MSEIQTETRTDTQETRGGKTQAEILEYHRAHAWQPFTQMKLTPDPQVIERAEGVNLYTKDGKEIIDAVGSWWVNIHGHNHPYINEAIQKQAGRLEHVMYSGFTHEPAAVLSKRLSDTTGGVLPRVFFSDNGSTAVEIGLKMAFQYFVNQGRSEKREFLTLTRGYHGDTIGTMSVGARSVFHEMYEPLLFNVVHSLAPECPFEEQNDPQKVKARLAPALEDLERIIKERGDKICGVILEPMIQGAGGMNIYPALYLQELRRHCDENDIFLIADEVFTGFGRTGEFYACRQAGVWPDILALSKGLSAGYLPFAATLASEKVFEGFYSDNRMHTLFHGHSMTANPLGCAAALAGMDIYESEDRAGDTRRLEKFHKQALETLRAGPLGAHIKETRFMGTVGVAEFQGEGNYTGDFGWKFWQGCIQAGVLLRPIGNVVYMTPPYIITDQELQRVYETLEKTALSILG